MNVGGSLWELAKDTIFNPRMGRDMAIVLGPVFLGTLIFAWYKIRHPRTENGGTDDSEEGADGDGN